MTDDGEEPFDMQCLVKRIEHRMDDRATSLLFYTAGGSSRAFIITLENGGDHLLRVHYPHGSERGLGLTAPNKLPSEIATMDYVRQNTTIPVPRVLCFDEDRDHRVGGEWILMELIPGHPLSAYMPSMPLDQQKAVATSIAEIQAQLLQLRFMSIGSLYKDLHGQVAVGPLTFTPSRNRFDFAPPSQDKCGPFRTVKEWLIAIARHDLRYLNSVSLDDHALNAQASSILAISNEIESACLDKPLLTDVVLDHVDICPHNLLVDPEHPTKVFSVIDWEGARAVPLFAVEPIFVRRIHPMFGFSEADVGVVVANFISELSQRAPEWAEAITEPGMHLRRLHRMAEFSTLPEGERCRYLDRVSWWRVPCVDKHESHEKMPLCQA